MKRNKILIMIIIVLILLMSTTCLATMQPPEVSSQFPGISPISTNGVTNVVDDILSFLEFIGIIIKIFIIAYF